LRDDFANGDVPQVVFIEPRYQDDYRRGTAQATDDHPPASLWGGQRFLNNIYEALTINQSVWENLMAILIYDEHGSFFDHIRPPGIPTEPPAGNIWRGGRFETLGARVPAIVVSPFVDAGSVQEKICDHTSILKLLGEKFGNGSYTPAVDARAVASASAVLSEESLASSDPIAPPPQM
jgi:phospholipase C